MTEDSLAPQARLVVDFAKFAAAGSFVPLLDVGCNSLRNCKATDWDYFATAGMVYLEMNALGLLIPHDRYTKLWDLAKEELNKWSPQGVEVVMDCFKFCADAIDTLNPETVDIEIGSSNKGKDFLTTDPLGMWILLNLHRRPLPNSEEHRKEISIIGLYLLRCSKDYWKL